MKFKIIFCNSGDSIPFDSTNDQILEYYVDFLNRQNLNKFSYMEPSFGKEISKTIESLNSLIINSNNWLSELINKSIDIPEFENYLDQNYLNKLHANWVKSQNILCQTHKSYKDHNLQKIHDLFPDHMKEASLSSILSKLNLLDEYGLLNIFVHKIESMFENVEFSIMNQTWVQLDNPFPKEILSYDRNNFQLPFNHLGRLLYNKFQTFDDNLEYEDENSFDQLLGFVSINLSKPETLYPSQEYRQWCMANNRNPTGIFLNLGNVIDLEKKLQDYRLIMYRNSIADNFFWIDI
jgi:hypothetical protein